MLNNAIIAGATDDGTISAALDAFREDTGCTLLAAVLEVAAVWRCACEAAELREAVGYLAHGSALREALVQSAAAECPEIPAGTPVTVVAIEGGQPPVGRVTLDWTSPGHPLSATVTVGALWIKREASLLMVELATQSNRRRRRRSN